MRIKSRRHIVGKKQHAYLNKQNPLFTSIVEIFLIFLF